MEEIDNLFKKERIVRHFVFGLTLANILILIFVTNLKMFDINPKTVPITFVALLLSVYTYFTIVKRIIEVAKTDGNECIRNSANDMIVVEILHSNTILISLAFVATCTGILFWISVAIGLVLMALYIFISVTLDERFVRSHIVIMVRDENLKVIAVYKYFDKYYEEDDDWLYVEIERGGDIVRFEKREIKYIICNTKDEEWEYHYHVDYILDEVKIPYEEFRLKNRSS